MLRNAAADPVRNYLDRATARDADWDYLRFALRSLTDDEVRRLGSLLRPPTACSVDTLAEEAGHCGAAAG